MKKNIAVIFVVLLTLLTIGCESKPKPEDTINKLFSSIKEVDVKSAKQTMVSSLPSELKDKAQKDIRKLVEVEGETLDLNKIKSIEGFDETSAYISELLSHLEYEIIDKVYNKDKTAVDVELKLTYSDIGDLIISSVGEMYSKNIGQKFSGVTLSNDEKTKIIINTFNNNIKEYNLKLNETTSSLKLIKVEDEWVISEIKEDIINGIMMGFNNSMTHIEKVFIENSKIGLIESSDVFESELTVLEVEASLREIYKHVDNEINKIVNITYDNFVDKHSEELSIKVSQLSKKKVRLAAKIGTEENVFYVTKGLNKNEILVTTITENGLISFDGS